MTTILGLGAMLFADFGKYRSGGPTIAISLIVALAACMTIAPALLRAMGRAVFWPFGVGQAIKVRSASEGVTTTRSVSEENGTKARGAGENGDSVGRPASQPSPTASRPCEHGARPDGARPVGLSSALRSEARQTAHPAAEAAPHTVMGRFWAAVGRQVVAHPGLILAGSFLVLAFPAWRGIGVPITYDMLAELNPKRESVQGMKLLEKHFLIGETGPIVVLAYRPGGNFDTKAERKSISAIAQQLQEFQYLDSRGDKTRPIDHVRCLTNPLGDPLGVKLSMRQLMRRNAIADNPESKRQFLSSGEHQGEVTRFELVTNYDPFSQESIRLVGSLDQWLKEQKAETGLRLARRGFRFRGHDRARIRDLDAVNRSDTKWVSVYVAVAVLIVLLFLIRRPLVSLYLIFTVVFGYLVSLGLTHLFFSWLYGATYQGLDWKLKMFLFVILVAVGEDYNIYLVTRVFEEQRRRGPLDGLREAVVRTGGIITSCGVIMAGTFGSMATGTLRSMVELGFAMSLGVLLDTFIIRTILVPAFLALLARWGVQSSIESRGDLSAPHYDTTTANDLVNASK